VRAGDASPPALYEAALPFGADPRLGALLDLLAGPALLLSTDFIVQDLNAAAEWLIGWPRATAIGRRFVELIALASEQPAVLQDLRQALGGTRVTGSEVWLRLPDGQEGRVVWSYTPLRDAAGRRGGRLAPGGAAAPPAGRPRRPARPGRRRGAARRDRGGRGRRPGAPQGDHGPRRRRDRGARQPRHRGVVQPPGGGHLRLPPHRSDRAHRGDAVSARPGRRGPG